MKNKMVPVRFPENIQKMLRNWRSCAAANVGWCLLGDGPIRSEDLIPKTNTHNCPASLRLELRGGRLGG